MSMPQQRSVLFEGAKAILLEIKRPVPTNKGNGRSRYVMLRRETGNPIKIAKRVFPGFCPFVGRKKNHEGGHRI